MDERAPSRRLVMLASIFVFAVALIVRVPSCYESLWLDELHSAWCVWGTLDEVFARALIGNQSPFYFVGLWFWRQIAGDSEVGLRFSSVLALGLSGIVLTVGVTRWTKCLAAGVTSGLIIALESNAIFFGTELRPYAFVILFGSVAIGCFLFLASTESRHQLGHYWSAMIIAILLAALCQPTSIGVLAFLPLLLCCIWLLRDSRQMRRVTRWDVLLALMAVAVGFVLWQLTLGESWRQRSKWEAFAAATRLTQIVEVWDWKWLLLLPLGLALVSATIAWFRGKITCNRNVLVTTLMLALIAVLSTILCWCVSRANLAPIWHRRYFIAVLPILACAVGGSVAVVGAALRPGWLASLTALIAAAAVTIGLAHQQRTLQRLPSYPVALAARGEDWRSANAWVNVNAKATDRIYLDSGLLEAHAWLEGDGVRRPTVRQLEYLLFAVRGPYVVRGRVLPTTLGRSLQPYQLPPEWSEAREKSSAGGRLIVITRRPANRVAPAMQSSGSRILGFGNLAVIVVPGGF